MTLDMATLISNTHFEHSRQAAKISALLAQLSGCPAEETEIIRQAALFHDIGKTQIPPAILNKPDELTREEFRAVQKHTSLGQNQLTREVQILNAAAIVAMQHHERLDGSGYLGLEDQDIHPYAKLVAVADVFDALVQARLFADRGDIGSAYGMAFTFEAVLEKTVLFARVMPAYTGHPCAAELTEQLVENSIPVEMGFTGQGWFCLRIPALLPKKEGGSPAYVRDFLYPATRRFFSGKCPVSYPDCVLIFRHVYDQTRPERAWRDHDNIEVNFFTSCIRPHWTIIWQQQAVIAFPGAAHISSAITGWQNLWPCVCLPEWRCSRIFCRNCKKHRFSALLPTPPVSILQRL